jgi:hypothetical protein
MWLIALTFALLAALLAIFRTEFGSAEQKTTLLVIEK